MPDRRKTISAGSNKARSNHSRVTIHEPDVISTASSSKISRKTISGAPRGLNQNETPKPKNRFTAMQRAVTATSFIYRIQHRLKQKNNKGKTPKKKLKKKAVTGIDRWIWPEWNETDVNSEKWDITQKKPDKGQGKAPTPSFFEDPDGQPILPRSLAEKCVQWRRIPEIYSGRGGGTTVFEETNPNKPISLLQSNTHLFHSPYARYLIGSIKSLQCFCLESEGLEEWRPWSLIYSLNKIGGREHKPLVNPQGKYIVKLFWVGKWRKIIVDDSIPCNEEGNPLLLTSANQNEIWPLVLCKALLKLTALSLSNRSNEIPESHVITAITGWIPEVFTGEIDVTWDLLTRHLPHWERSEPPVTPHLEKDSKKDKKEKKKKDEKEPGVSGGSKYALLCLASIELTEAEPHPAWVVKTRDKPLRIPSPPPEIPKWKLIRPQPDVLQILDDIEKAKIPNRWCQVRSPFNSEQDTEGGEDDLDGDHETEWIRIDELAGKHKIVLFHRNANPNYSHQTEYLPAIKENIKGTSYKYLITDSKRESLDIIVNFNVQNKKNEWPTLNQEQSGLQGVPLIEMPSEDPQIEYDALKVHEKEITQNESSTLSIQNYSLLKYMQKPDPIIGIETYAQGSIRFTLPKGRSVLRFQLATRYVSNIDVLVERADDVVQFGTLDKIIPFAAALPFSWEEFGSQLIKAVRHIVDSLGDMASVKESFRALSLVLGTAEYKDLWACFQRAFYKLASDTLGDSAIPEDLGALRLIFQDCVPSPGPQPYFRQVRTAVNANSTTELDPDIEELTNGGNITNALTAATMIARNWRGAACRKNVNALSGQSAGAIRRRTSAKNRMDNLYAKFDSKVNDDIVKLLMIEANWPVNQIKNLTRDEPHTFSLSALDGKFPLVQNEWGIIFREAINVKKETELFPFFTEIGTDPNVCRTRVRLIDEEGNELSTLLRKVNPVKVQPGTYIIIGEVESSEEQVAGSWKLQLISSPLASNLITPRDTLFSTKTENGCYLPPTPSTYEPGLLFRYNIKVKSDRVVLASFHLSCNSLTAKLKMILKREGEQICVAGAESSILIPAVSLQPSSESSTSLKQDTSETRIQGNERSKTEDKNSRIEKNKRKSETVARIIVSHKTKKKPLVKRTLVSEVLSGKSTYVIEGYCTGDWILSDEEMQWVEKLRIDEENEIKVFGHVKESNSDTTVKEKKKSSSKVNSPDIEQASWLLKIFTEQDQQDLIELMPDNSRKENVRAMKLAWEAAEPGRHAKGYEARRAYLSSFEEGTSIPTIDELMDKARKGSREADPEVLIQNFAERRKAVEDYRRKEEDDRKKLLVDTQKQYEELNERENRIFEQINYSLQIPPLTAESR